MFSAVLADTTFALRQFRRKIGFCVTVVVTLALGIGAATSIFSLVDGILLRPLPFPQADRLVAIDTLAFPPGASSSELSAADWIGTSYPDFFDWRQESRTFKALASCDRVSRLISKSNGEGARVLRGARVSANLFPALGVAPTLGRNFTEDEETPGHRVVILSHELWVSDFGSSPDVIGQVLKISDEPSIIVGVMPPGFHFPTDEPAYFWATFAADKEGPAPNISNRAWNRLDVLGRLKDRVTVQEANAELNTIQHRLADHYSEDRRKLGITVTPLLDEAVDDVRSALKLLLAAVGLVLLIACANVAGLLLAQGSARRSEVALRSALGASRARILRQLLVEALLLALAGGVGGIVLSHTLLRLGLHYVPSQIPRLYNVSINVEVLAFAVALSAITSLLFGMLPAWNLSHADPAGALREGSVSVTCGRSRHRLYHALVVGETALGFALLIGSGLVIRSVLNVLAIESGFDDKHTVTFDVALTDKRYPTSLKVAFYDKLIPALAGLPGIERVSCGHPLPLYGPHRSWASFTIVGRINPSDDLPGAITTAVDPGFFETLSIPLLHGRTFTAHDNDPKSPPVAVVNRSFVQNYFPNEDPIGRQFVPQFKGPDGTFLARQIVGIVGDTETSDVLHPYQPQFYLPYAQDPAHQRPLVVMKVNGDPHIYENEVRRVVASIDKDTPIFRYLTFPEDATKLTAQPRFEATLISIFSGIALLLSSIGLYAVLSFIVAERTRELGLRLALGASRGDVLRLVMLRGLTLTVIGITIGTASSILGNKIFADLLFGVKPLDRSVFLTVIVVVSAVSAVAALGPALRAANLDPMRTLREQ